MEFVLGKVKNQSVVRPLVWVFLSGIVLAVLLSWGLDPGFSADLIYEVPTFTLIGFFENPALYAWVHLFSVIPVLVLSFDKRVHYYTSWKYLFPATFIVAAIFIIWDVIFTSKGVWGFNEAYFLGIKWFGLPIEEWLFFITIPFASIFIYECLNYYVPKDWMAPADKWLTPLLIVLFLGIGIFFFNRIYTSTTFLLTGGFLLFHWLFIPNTYRTRFYFAYLVIWIPFLIVDGVLTGGATQEPIVLYNPEEFLGLRVISVPIEDSIYGLLLLFGIVTIMEHWKGPSKA